MDIKRKKEEYEKFIQNEKLIHIKNLEINIFTLEEEKYISGYIVKDQEEHISIMINVNENIPQKEKENEIKKIRELYDIPEIKDEEDYLDFVFYHEFGHIQQYEKFIAGDPTKKKLRREEEIMNKQREALMERFEKGEISEEVADKLYRELPLEKDADEYAKKKLKK